VPPVPVPLVGVEAGAVELVGVEGAELVAGVPPPVEPQLRTGGPGMVYGFPPMFG